MAYNSLTEFVQVLEREGELKRVTYPVRTELEITEIADRVMKSAGPALLFENVLGKQIPVLINVFGSAKRMALALGVREIEEIAREVEKLVQTKPPKLFKDKLKLVLELVRLAGIPPKTVKEGECQQVIHREPDLNILPVLTCWPGDAGPFITLPTVFSKDPRKGTRNVGLYRMQIYDSRTTGMHWHLHKVGARHYEQQKAQRSRMELAVCLGGDPTLIYAATAPLPDQIDEILFAGFLRKKGVELVKGVTVDVEVPANADIVIEGYVDPSEPLRREGPFGDHTGFYSLADDYPVFHVTCITQKQKPFYPTTIVGTSADGGCLSRQSDGENISAAPATHLPRDCRYESAGPRRLSQLGDSLHQKGIPGPCAQNHARALGHGPDDVYQDSANREP